MVPAGRCTLRTRQSSPALSVVWNNGVSSSKPISAVGMASLMASLNTNCGHAFPFAVALMVP